MDQAQIDDIVRAYHFGAEAHTGQFRKSGEAYICHPVSVAIYLAEMRMDAKGIMAALLHDVLEDTSVTKKDLAHLFSTEVAELVDGVTKLSKIDSHSRAEAQAENVRKMFLAMTKDLRVIMVKLADRLHNMQTLGVMPPEKKRRIARETLDIYAPLANRLGMNQIKHQLESLGFKALYPGRQLILKNAVRKARGNRREIVETIENSIKNRLQQAGLACEVVGREKNLYSIYQKMLTKKISFNDVFDVYAFRILSDQVDTCYRALGVVHNLYKPVPGRFKDYIALSKANGYQSLHTILIGPYGVPIEIQIRTQEMHRMSESGIAAHWLYKTDNEKTEHAQMRANEWLRELLEIHKSAGDSMEFIDNLKIDLYPQEVFVFTPQGGIIKLPRGATIVDFAYAVHTDIGNSCVSARIDKQLVPLQTQLENGVTVEVITASWARPNPLWLNYVVTAKARSSIRAYLKHFKQQEAISLGRRLLEKELQGMNLQLETISQERIFTLLDVLASPSLDALLEDIGLGNKMPFLVAKRLSQDDIYAAIKLEDNEKGVDTPLIIKGTEGMVVTLAKCCRPIPGDSIVGFFNPGRGIVVHHHECRNSNDIRKKQTSWLDVEWSKETTGEFPAEIRLELLNQRGTLANVAATISEMDSNIENVTVVDQDDRVSVDLITLTVRDRVHLANIMRRLRKLMIVLKITRVKA
ncbi:bifunctional (p)ppGpp synthetase/guanosine-3',5'-bis(diphosphate) 3'-pyrophosphohydrolase [Methylicorpusculum sp.]